MAKSPTMFSLSDLFSASEPMANRELPSMPQLEAQAMELIDRWTRTQTPDLRLVPGALCVERRGLGNMAPEARADTLMIIWRMLDSENEIDWLHIAQYHEANAAGFDRPDVLVGELHRGANGAVVTIRAHQLAQLELWSQGQGEDED